MILWEVEEGAWGEQAEGRQLGRPGAPRSQGEGAVCDGVRFPLSERTDVSCLWLAVGSGFHLPCLCTRRFIAALISSLQNNLVARMSV